MTGRLFSYQTGEEVRPGDSVLFHGDPGVVKFVVAEPTGDKGRDWYLEEYPEGGVMIEVDGWGLVFLNETSDDEDLELVARGGPA